LNGFFYFCIIPFLIRLIRVSICGETEENSNADLANGSGWKGFFHIRIILFNLPDPRCYQYDD
jgi:hypothetical protein